jgi:hypothetical protein
MTVEERLRDALKARADSVEPVADGLSRIDAALTRHRRSATMVRVTSLVALGVAAAFVVGIVIVSRDSSESIVVRPPLTDVSMVPPPTTSPATSVAPVTTTPPVATTAVVPVSPPPAVGQPTVAVWPYGKNAPFPTSADAALDFARNFLGMSAAVVGPTHDNTVDILDVQPDGAHT